MSDQAMNIQCRELENEIERLDMTEKSMLLYTLQVIASYKSKGAKTRRWNEFEAWIKDYRARKTA